MESSEEKGYHFFFIALFFFLIATTATSLVNYLLFHTIAELFPIIIGCLIFMVAWTARDRIESSYLLFIGIGYLFIAGVDLLHTLAFKGVNYPHLTEGACNRGLETARLQFNLCEG